MRRHLQVLRQLPACHHWFLTLHLLLYHLTLLWHQWRFYLLSSILSYFLVLISFLFLSVLYFCCIDVHLLIDRCLGCCFFVTWLPYSSFLCCLFRFTPFNFGLDLLIVIFKLYIDSFLYIFFIINVLFLILFVNSILFILIFIIIFLVLFRFDLLRLSDYFLFNYRF